MDETTFRASLAQDGFTEVLVREVPANAALPEHHHAWDARLMVLQGQLQLTRAGGTETFTAGHHCEVLRNQPHAELHGTDGCTRLIGRRYAADAA